MKIITSGSRYLDIDAYAGCIAYAELLQKRGVPAKVVSTAPLNESIPPIVRAWPAVLETAYVPSADDAYVLIDISEPEYFDTFVDPARVQEVIDHHAGREDYWQQRLGTGAQIEHVGAACTQVFERWEQASMLDQISEASTRLLMCGILDNTLNFTADVTTERDHHAYTELAKRANLPDDWPAQYFNACQQSIMANITGTIQGDTKIIKFQTFPYKMAVGQLTIWDAKDAVQQSLEVCKQTLETVEPYWFMNIIGIKDGKSYLVTDVPEVTIWLSDLLEVQFDGNLAVANRTWLRKEMLKADIHKNTQD